MGKGKLRTEIGVVRFCDPLTNYHILSSPIFKNLSSRNRPNLDKCSPYLAPCARVVATWLSPNPSTRVANHCGDRKSGRQGEDEGEDAAGCELNIHCSAFNLNAPTRSSPREIQAAR